MRHLTSTQEQVLERIGSSAAGKNASVVGWADDGPVVRVKSRLYVITTHGSTNPVQELAFPEG